MLVVGQDDDVPMEEWAASEDETDSNSTARSTMAEKGKGRASDPPMLESDSPSAVRITLCYPPR